MPRNNRVAQSTDPNEEKDAIISAEYNDIDTGFRGINNMFRTLKDKGITMSYLRKWFDRNIEKNTLEGKGKNSFVAPRANFEYQWDLFFVTDKQFVGQIYKVGLSVIDIFIKKATVIPLKKKTEDELISGLEEAFKQLGGKPLYLYSDNDGAIGNEYHKFCVSEKIAYIITRTHAHFVERFHRTFRGMLHKRMAQLISEPPKDNKDRKMKRKANEETGLSNVQWSGLVPQIIATYNNTVHSTTKLTPNDAMKPDNKDNVKANIELKASFNRRYPEIKVGDMVRIVRKKVLGEKEHVGKFLQSLHKVVKIVKAGHRIGGQVFYKVEGYDRPLIRADIALHKLQTALFSNRMA
jgi:hypothetical protein